MNSEWSGWEEWFISLFADPTLSGFRKGEIEEAVQSKDESNAFLTGIPRSENACRASSDTETTTWT